MAIKRLRIDPNKLNTITENRADVAQTQLAPAREWVNEFTQGGRLTEHDHRENQVLVKAHRKALSLSLDMNDLMTGIGHIDMPGSMFPEDRQGISGDREFLTEEFPTAHDNYIMEDLYRPRSQPATPRQNQPRQALREQIVGNRHATPAPPPGNTRPHTTPPPAGPPWRVKAFLGETRGGDEIPVWKVANTKTGSTIDKLFRIEGVAVRVAGLLNESGDINDPRALSLIAVYDKRDKLLKEARLLEKTAAGKPMKTQRLQAIQAEINQLDRRLGD
jgi:hypothetical protein